MSSHTFSHCALLYQGEDQLLDGVTRFLAPGIEAGDPILVALAPSKLDAVRRRIGARRIRESVEMVDMLEAGRNPGRLIPAFRRAFERHRGSGRFHLVGEPVWPGRTSEEVNEALTQEALINRAFDGEPVRALCTYDVTGLEPEVLAAARQTHPHVLGEDGVSASPEYSGGEPPRCCQVPLPAPPPDAAALEFSLPDLTRVRALVRERAAAAGLDAARRNDLVLAVNELATNSVRHGGGSGCLRAWTERERLVYEIRDGGRISDPLAAQAGARPDGDGGHGLWLVHQLADLAQVRTGAEGTTIRLHAALSPA